MWIFKRGFRVQESGVRKTVDGIRYSGYRLRSTVSRLPSSPCRLLQSSIVNRQSEILLLSALCLLLSASLVFALRGRYAVTEVKPHVFVWVPEDIHDFDGDPRFSLPGTAGFVIGPQGVVVVNTTNSPFHAREVLYEIRERTDQPVRYVIDTDARGDHMLGNEAFVDERPTIIASSAAAAAMRAYRLDIAQRMDAEGEPGFRMRERMRGIHFTLPTETIDKDLTIGVGGEEIRMLLTGAGPSPGSLVVFLPQSKVLFLGDLYENGFIPKLQGVDLEKWAAYLRTVESWDVDVYVPGHGAPGDKKSLAEFLKFLEWSEKNTRPAPSEETSLTRTHAGPLRRAAEEQESSSNIPRPN
jgi:glyoxylase-like metal-dependent hydrolase (beta-lactamase superfamily II)